TVDFLRRLLSNGSNFLTLSPTVNVTQLDLSTVCSPISGDYQCRCEDQYRFPCDQCVTYGSCDNITGDTCGCISGIPAGGQYCQAEDQYKLLVQTEYVIDLELNLTDIATVDFLRRLLSNGSNFLTLSPTVNVTQLDLSTVCSPISGDYQCRCEDQYRFPCDQCVTYGSCDNITGDTCGCISGIPAGGQYCQAEDQYTPPPVYEYVISIELKAADDEVVAELRNISYPVSINSNIHISDVNISTVCSPISGDYQCRCEDQYRFPCDQCVTYGSCDNITGDTCGCISGIPAGGQYCQAEDQYSPPVFHQYLLSIELNSTDVTVVEKLRNINNTISMNRKLRITDVNITTVCSPISGDYQCRCEDQYRFPCDQCVTYGPCDNITDDTCGCISGIPAGGQYCQAEDQYIMNITTPATTVMNTTAPGTTVVDTTTPGTTVMNTTTPGTTVMNTTTPGTTVVDTTTPGTTVMNTTTPGTTVVDTTTPGTTVMNTTTPGTTVVDTTTPGTTVVDTTTPETTIMNTTTPGTTVMNTTTSGTTVMNTTTPGTTVVDTTTPGTTVMNTTTPETTVMNTTTSGTTVMNTTTPGTTVVDTTTSGTTVVETTTTGTTVVDTTTSRTTVVETTTTGTTVVDTTTPRTTVMNTTTSGTTITTINMSVELNMDFIEQYNNPDSPEYKILSRNITVLQQYRKLNGFLNVSVTKFRKGSVVTDFTVKVKSESFDVTALNSVNSKLPAALISIAPVIGSVTAKYYSKSKIPRNIFKKRKKFIYTGKTMTLTCDPTEAKMGNTKNPVWKFNNVVIGSHRHKPFISESQYKLAVENVILGDAGNYECSVQGDNITFIQDRNVGTNEIRSAPNVRVQQTMLAKCKEGKKEPVVCCVQSPYTVRWYDGSTLLTSVAGADPGCIKYEYPMQSCSAQTKLFTCKVAEDETYSATATLTIFTDPRVCYNDVYGSGRTGDKATAMCPVGLEGHKSAVCQASGEWKLVEDSCIVTKINELLINSVDLKEEEIQVFSTNLSKVVSEEEKKISQSSATISAIVNILNIIAEVSKVVTKDVMKNVLDTVDVLISDDAKDSWNFLNSNETQNSSSALLGSMETISNKLDGNFTLSSRRIQMGRSKFSNSFSDALTSNVSINLQNTGLSDVFITTIVFSTLHNIMPSRNSSFNLTASDTTSNETKPDNAINAAVLLVKLNETIRNVTLSYQKFNTTLELNPQCVFWNFSLLDNLGAWDDQGCRFVSDINDTVTCTCNHLTSFSILMSTAIPEELRLLLDIMTYIGVGISMISLIICLIIEGIVWRPLTKNSTAFMRHVAIVNTALSLLIADICFIIGAAISKNPAENPGEDYKVPVGPCSAATFFMHFFYLAMFFWMLDSSLLLLYRSVLVFSQMSKWTMFAIGLTVGYVCPLIIAVTTVAATAPGGGYVREDLACWLNWTKTKALLALVIPALAIVVFNILVILVVLYKMLRRRNTNQADEKHALVVILRCVAILSPLFGLTWCLGIGTMVDPTNGGIHVAFAFFNSLQGFFILVFGTLFDSKVCFL
uniref:Adhesion G protein-coupled receptor F5-like n=1 Tax=Xiphophorus maculatus TaxID=8083 RepID=A0A3B5QJZ5_XIPMA